MNDGKKIIEKNSGSKISKKSKENEKIILKPMKYIKVTTYEDCFQIMNPLPKTVERLSKLPFKPKSQRQILCDLNNDYKWDDPSGTFRRRTDLVKSYIACKNGLPPEMISPTSRPLKQALFDHYQHMWPSFVAKENFTRQQLLDFAIAAYKYFPIPNENEDLDIDRRLISNFITIYQKDNHIARKAVNGPTLRRIQEIRSGTRYIPKFFLTREGILISRNSHDSSYYRNTDLYMTKAQRAANRIELSDDEDDNNADKNVDKSEVSSLSALLSMDL